MTDDQRFLMEAYKEAQASLGEGGIPIGAALVRDERVIGLGRNRRVQRESAVLHAETDCLENIGRLAGRDYRNTTLYTTLSPCAMCCGAIALYGIPRVVIGENSNFVGEEDWLRSRGVRIEVLDDRECIEMMRGFIAKSPDLWHEDIGE